jgi:putative hemolysin
MRNADKLAMAMSGLVSVISKIFAPVVWFLTISTNGLLRLFGVDPNAEDDTVTEEEIRMLVDAGSERGAIDPEEKVMIQNIFEFDDTFAADIMTHRTEVSVLWLDETDEEWEKTIHESRYSVYPICADSVDDIAGVLYVKEIIPPEGQIPGRRPSKRRPGGVFRPERSGPTSCFATCRKTGRTLPSSLTSTAA